VSVQGRRTVAEEPVSVRFSGELDAGDRTFADELQACLAGGSPWIIVDMLNVSFIDSSVIRELVLAHRATTAEGGWLRVVYTHHVVRRVIEMCGLTEVFPQHATLDAACRNLVSPPPSSEWASAEERSS
jgi:anti-sigma B factor antagonist